MAATVCSASEELRVLLVERLAADGQAANIISIRMPSTSLVMATCTISCVQYHSAARFGTQPLCDRFIRSHEGGAINPGIQIKLPKNRQQYGTHEFGLVTLDDYACAIRSISSPSGGRA